MDGPLKRLASKLSPANYTQQDLKALLKAYDRVPEKNKNHEKVLPAFASLFTALIAVLYAFANIYRNFAQLSWFDIIAVFAVAIPATLTVVYVVTLLRSSGKHDDRDTLKAFLGKLEVPKKDPDEFALICEEIKSAEIRKDRKSFEHQ